MAPLNFIMGAAVMLWLAFTLAATLDAEVNFATMIHRQYKTVFHTNWLIKIYKYFFISEDK